MLSIALAVAALFLLPPLIFESRDFRQRVREEAAARFGREVEYGDVSVSLDPPGLKVASLQMVGSSDRAPALIEVDSVRISAPATALLQESPIGGSLFAERAGVRIAPSTRLVLVDLRGELREDPTEGVIDFALEGVLSEGGSVALSGRSAPDGHLEARVELQAAELSALAPLFPEVSELSGSASGILRFAGRVRNPQTFDLDLGIERARLVVQQFALRRRLQIKAELAGLLAAVQPSRGSFEIDATGARMRYGQFYQKPPGTPASVGGQLLRRPDGSFGVGALRLEVGK